MKKILFCFLVTLSVSPVWATLNVTCANKSLEACTVGGDTQLVTSCDAFDMQKFTEETVLYFDQTIMSQCNEKIYKFTNKDNRTLSSCPYIVQTAIDTVNGRQYIFFCISADVNISYTNEETDKWSYDQKKCVGSGGTWTNNSCDCTALSGTRNINSECICLNRNKKYFDKLRSGCETLKDGVINVMSGAEMYGYKFDLSKIDKADSCGITGGEWTKLTNTCTCNSRLNLVLDNSGYFCNCTDNMDYTDPLDKYKGCSLISADTTQLDTASSTTSTNSIQSAPTESPTNPEIVVDLSECEKSGGEPDETNNTCVCDAPYETTTEIANDKTFSICKCVAGYKRANGNFTDECVDAGETTTEQVLDTAKMREQAEAAYQAARDHEQSWANKGLTAGTTMATGLGTMTAASAFAEQRADAAAEADMRDYLATFKCEYGDGQTLNAGNEEITLPGGNELLEYYTEYKTLADSVKQTKTALGLRAGIESETLYDRAQTGLYQYTTAERLSGGEISLARALSDETSTDAARWAEQKAATASNLKTGAAVAVTGAAAGIAGNYLINKNYKPTELQQEFTEITKKLIKEYPQTFIPAPNEVSIPEQENKPQEKLTLEIPAVAGTAFETSSYKLNQTGKQGLDGAINQITSAMEKVPNSIISIQTIGHTDLLGISADTQKKQGYRTNQELSEKRSKTVSDYLQNSLSQSLGDRVRFEAPIGQGETWCRENNRARNDAECRRVDINITDLTTYEQ